MSPALKFSWDSRTLGSQRPFSQPSDILSSPILTTFPSASYPSFKLSPFLHQMTLKVWFPRATLSLLLFFSSARPALTVPASQVIHTTPRMHLPPSHAPPLPHSDSYPPTPALSPSLSLGVTPILPLL